MVPKVLLCLIVMAVGVTQAQELRVKRSDVVFMGAKDVEIYDAYGATMVSWGGKAGTTKAAENWFRRRVEAAHERGLTRWSARDPRCSSSADTRSPSRWRRVTPRWSCDAPCTTVERGTIRRFSSSSCLPEPLRWACAPWDSWTVNPPGFPVS